MGSCSATNGPAIAAPQDYDGSDKQLSRAKLYKFFDWVQNSAPLLQLTTFDVDAAHKAAITSRHSQRQSLGNGDFNTAQCPTECAARRQLAVILTIMAGIIYLLKN
jgi:hypothetical protein